MPDTTYASQMFTITLKTDESKEVMMIFTPDDASGLVLRGYFIEVYLNGVKAYTMKSSYPPRLEVH